MTSDPRKTTNNLLAASFDAAYLASHSLTGAASNKSSSAKPAIDKDAVANIICEYTLAFSTQQKMA